MDVLDRLNQRLRDAAARHGRDAPLTVADVYQHLVPYRLVRSDLGLWELAQYEHALLRLLSGERGYLRLEDPAAQAEIARELASPNPILGIYRDYATVGLRLLSDPPVAPDAVAAPSSPVPPPVPAASAHSPPGWPDEPGPPDAAPVPPDAAPEPVVAAAARACRACRAALPEVEGLRFCPDCGADQREVPCHQCGAALRAEWNFCIRCGTRRAPAAVAAAP